MYDKVYIPEPSFSSNLTKLITELEKLRNDYNIISQSFGIGYEIFFGLKKIFQVVESVASARIEGNRTTVSQFIRERYVENKDERKEQKRQEIQNIYEGISFIDEIKEKREKIIINNQFFSQLHQILMKDLLTGGDYEGDLTPGSYRDHNVTISKSSHIPPDFHQVQPYMDELVEFINEYKKGDSQFDLLKVAIAHHRFVWIHPYGNGNGRMVRLLTYAMLLKYGFDIGNFGLLNPSSLFSLDRETYYDYLNGADDGSKKGLLEWSTYAISGIHDETKKLELLCQKSFVVDKILSNALGFLYNSGEIDEYELKILKILYNKGEISAKDVRGALKLHPTTISGKLKHLKDIFLITSQRGKKTRYIPIFVNDNMFNAIFHELANNGFDNWLNLDKFNK